MLRDNCSQWCSNESTETSDSYAARQLLCAQQWCSNESTETSDSYAARQLLCAQQWCSNESTETSDSYAVWQLLCSQLWCPNSTSLIQPKDQGVKLHRLLVFHHLRMSIIKFYVSRTCDTTHCTIRNKKNLPLSHQCRGNIRRTCETTMSWHGPWCRKLLPHHLHGGYQCQHRELSGDI